MCGIIGIISKKQEVFNSLVAGLETIQHRGQDACGIATCSGESIQLKKGLNSVKDVFKSRSRTILKGKSGIGHTRYPTQGEENVDDAQPLAIRTDPRVAIALNGNTTNYYALRDAIRKKGVKLQTKVDTELILLIFAKNYEKNKDFFKAASAIFSKIEGAYSIVGLIAGKGLFAIRDPRGIRPLVMGKKAGSYVLASETTTLQKLGYRFLREVEPGEAILISNDLKVRSKTILRNKKAFCMFEGVYFSDKESRIGGKSIMNLRSDLGARLATQVKKTHIDMVVPVPSGGIPAAAGLSKAAKIQYTEALKRDKMIPRTFIMPSPKIREEASRLKYHIDWNAIEDKDVGLVDDSIVRGTTSKNLVRHLKTGGVNRVVFISSCPPIRFPCYYGINMSTRQELIASKRSIAQVRKYLRADKVVYSNVSDIRKVFGNNICTACLTGNYPVRIPKRQMIKLSMQRALQANKLNIMYSQVIKKLQESTAIADRYRTRDIVKMDLPYLDLLLTLQVRWYRKWYRKLKGIRQEIPHLKEYIHNNHKRHKKRVKNRKKRAGRKG